MSLASITIPLAPFAPDQSEYNPQLADSVTNVMPTNDGYGPVGDWTAVGTGLPSECLGDCTVRLESGSYAYYAATATKLYLYNSGTTSFDDVTRTSGGDYAGPAAGYKWSMVQFGSYLIATNGVDDVQFIDVDSGSNFAALAGSPPKARYVHTSGEFVVLSALASNYRKLRWSGIGDSEFWTVGQKNCDEQAMPDGGEITGFIGYESGGVVLQRNKIRAMTPDAGYVFRFSTIQNALGSVEDPSIIEFRNTFFFISDGGFYQGIEALPIGEELVNKWFFRTVDDTRLAEIQGTADPEHKIAWWACPKTDDTWFLLGYQWLLKKWCYVDVDVSFIAASATAGYTIDNIDSFGTIDTLPYSLDHRFWKGGLLNLAAFDTDGNFGFFHGSNLEATVETNDVNLVPGRNSFVQSIRLVSNAASGVTGKVGGRDNPGATMDWTSSLTPSSVSGKMLARKRGRSHRTQITIAAGTEWFNANGVEFIYKQSGDR
ncbi:MAG: hypothetical protein GY943_30590 [Chloroflexi bacterium]|nr:hypothetical protein [Chloroflexota bacterium]